MAEQAVVGWLVVRCGVCFAEMVGSSRSTQARAATIAATRQGIRCVNGRENSPAGRRPTWQQHKQPQQQAASSNSGNS